MLPATGPHMLDIGVHTPCCAGGLTQVEVKTVPGEAATVLCTSQTRKLRLEGEVTCSQGDPGQ